MGQPNELSFLPDDYLERKAQRRANAICAIMFVLVMGGVGSAFTLSERATRRVDAEYARVEKQYLAEAQRLEQVRQMQEKQKRMAHQAELTASLLEKVPRSFLLAEITNSMPAGVSLLDLNMESKVKIKPAAAPGAAGAAGGPAAPKTAYEQKKAAKAGPAAPPLPEAKSYEVTIKVTGVAQTDVQVAQFLSKLSRSRILRDVNLVITDEFKQAGGEEKLRRFQIDMMLNPDATVDVTERKAQTSVELGK
jgi:Tfp pilus assembly protein PilN